MVIVVIATTEDEVASVRARVGERGVGRVQVVAPSDARRLVLVAVDDERDAGALASALRAEGKAAVTRPDAGVRLEAWMRDTSPLMFGERLSVCCAWSEHERGDVSRLVELGVGGFGSGKHPSTRLVLEQLLARIKGGERVLDVGCGSGVLGLCRAATRGVVRRGHRHQARRHRGDPTQRRPQRHAAARRGDACSARGDRGRVRRRGGECRPGGSGRVRAGARPARVAGRLACRQWHLALTVFARRRVPPSARGTRAPRHPGSGRPSFSPTATVWSATAAVGISA